MSIHSQIVTDMVNNNIEFITTVPCKQLGGVIEEAEKNPSIMHVPCNKEDEGMGLCAGAFMGGKRSAIIIRLIAIGDPGLCADGLKEFPEEGEPRLLGGRAVIASIDFSKAGTEGAGVVTVADGGIAGDGRTVRHNAPAQADGPALHGLAGSVVGGSAPAVEKLVGFSRAFVSDGGFFHCTEGGEDAWKGVRGPAAVHGVGPEEFVVGVAKQLFPPGRIQRAIGVRVQPGTEAPDHGPLGLRQ